MPTFYERDSSGLPHAWIAHVRASIRTAASCFSADRIVSDYVQRVYLAPTPRAR